MLGAYRAPAAGTPRPSQRTLRWARIGELGEAIMAGGEDPAQLV